MVRKAVSILCKQLSLFKIINFYGQVVCLCLIQGFVLASPSGGQRPSPRVKRDTPGYAPPPQYAPEPVYHAPKAHGRVGPVYTFVKTDPQANFKWGVRHRAGAQYGKVYGVSKLIYNTKFNFREKPTQCCPDRLMTWQYIINSIDS